MRVLLHICCAVCAAGAAERLILEGHQVHGFFYNPNIHPEDEYYRRLEAAGAVRSVLKYVWKRLINSYWNQGAILSLPLSRWVRTNPPI